MEDSKHPRSKLLELRGNRVVPLDDPDSTWVVESGSVAVFTAVLRQGQPVGRRRFVFSCGPTDLLFGLPRVAEGHPSVIAVALEDSLLRRLPLSELGAAEERARPLVEGWVERWSAVVGESDDPGAGEPLARLASFQRRLVESIEDLQIRKGREEISRLRDREQRSLEVTREAVGRLTSILRADDRNLPGGPDLFVAVCAVGSESGITFRQPPASEVGEGGEQTVEAIARASHVRFRQVLLHDGWRQQDCGPLLGFTREGGRPVALLPEGPGGYRLFDPATKARAPLDRAVTATLKPEAYQFYRPLPEQATGAMTLLAFALRGRARDIGIILAAGIAATLLGMFTPQATALLVDRAIPDADTRLIWQIGLGLAAAAIGGAIFRLSQGIALCARCSAP